MTFWTVRVWGFAASLTIMGEAAAAPFPVEPTALAYDVPPSCPNRDDFASEIGRRTQRVIWSELGVRPKRSLSVSVWTTDSGFRGRLVLGRGDAPTLSREFEDSVCGVVVSALALVAALAIDPEANTEQLQGSEGDATNEAPSREGSPAEGIEAGQGIELPPRSSSVRLSRAREAPPTPSTASRSPPAVWLRPASATLGRWYLLASAGLASLWGPAPEPLVALFPTLGVQRRTSRGLSALLRASPTFAQTGLLGPDSDRAIYRYLALRTELCGHIHIGQVFEVGPCLVGDGGMLKVSGDNLPVVYHATRPWVAFGPALDIAWASQPMVRLTLGLVLPVIRDEFVALPAEHLHRAPWAAGSGAAAIGLRFPK